MTTISTARASGIAPAPPQDERLRDVVKSLEGVFVEQLFKAMRETVPTDGLTGGGSGEEMFSGMLDQHLAAAVPGQLQSGLGESLLAQLRPALARQELTNSSRKGTQ